MLPLKKPSAVSVSILADVWLSKTSRKVQDEQLEEILSLNLKDSRPFCFLVDVNRGPL